MARLFGDNLPSSTRLQGGVWKLHPPDSDMPETKITLLNAMADNDFERSLSVQKAWGITALDLKDNIFDKGILDLSKEEAKKAAELVCENGQEIYCMSTALFADTVDKGEQFFRENHLAKVDRAIEIAQILKPKVIRLLSAGIEDRKNITDAIAVISARFTRIIDIYREAIDMINDAGFLATIENEVGKSIFSTTDEICGFFDELDRNGRVTLTWDAANLWQMGTFPNLETYEKIKHLIGYYHVKGGAVAHDTGEFSFCSSLEDAGWPVVEVTARVLEDDCCDVICLNPSHGRVRAGDSYDYSPAAYKKDLDFIQNLIREART